MAETKKPMNTKEAIAHMQKSKKVKDYQFTNKGTTSIQVPTTNSAIQNLGQYAHLYTKLINTKILRKEDKKKTFINDVIKHRKKILQHRLIGNITLLGNKGTLAKLQIPYLLIEHETIINQIVTGRIIDQYTIKSIANEIQSALEPEGIHNVEITQQPTYTKGTFNTDATCEKTNIEITYR